jgi:hypothetical protein
MPIPCMQFFRRVELVCLAKVENYGMAYMIDTVHVVVAVRAKVSDTYFRYYEPRLDSAIGRLFALSRLSSI